MGSETLGERWSLSRCTHWCNSCGGPIYDREKYHRLAVLEGQAVYNYREHVCCASAVVVAASVLDDDPIPVSDFDMDRMRALLEYDSAIYTELAEVLARPRNIMEDYQ